MKTLHLSVYKEKTIKHHNHFTYILLVFSVEVKVDFFTALHQKSHYSPCQCFTSPHWKRNRKLITPRQIAPRRLSAWENLDLKWQRRRQISVKGNLCLYIWPALTVSRGHSKNFPEIDQEDTMTLLCWPLSILCALTEKAIKVQQ